MYIGRANIDGQLVIGKLLINGPWKGLWMAYGGKEQQTITGVQYYAKESRCNYSWKPSSNGETVKNAVGFSSAPFTFYVGRAYDSNSVQVGKVTLEHRTMYYAYDGSEKTVDSYEVLVCKKR